MSLGPIPRSPGGLIGLLGLTNEGRFPAQLSELINPGLDYFPFLAAGVGLRVFQASASIGAGGAVVLQTPQDRWRMVWGVGVSVLATGAIANWEGVTQLGYQLLSIPLFPVSLGALAVNQVKVAGLWFDQPIVLPPGSDITQATYVAAASGFTTVSVYGIEFQA
jgi:hypothetical protein